MAHEPVLLQQVLDALSPRDGGVYLDGTLGGGGHTRSILEASAPSGRVVGFDRDERACHRVMAALAEYEDRLSIHRDDFRNVDSYFAEPAFDGILLDLGVSSFHFDDPAAGFSFRLEGPLDMRMDRNQRRSAATIVGESSQDELAEVIKEYGEERNAARIARAIVAARDEEPLTSTTQLAEIVRAAIPRKFHPKHHDAATRTFQALRIAVNDELTGLDTGLRRLAGLLKKGGVLAVISFHSLEDRIVKWALRELAGQGKKPDVPPELMMEEEEPDYSLPHRKPIVADDDEQERNPRSRSAKLRTVRRERV